MNAFGPRTALLIALACFLMSTSSAKELGSDWGFIVDMPSGFQAGDGDGKTRFSYADPQGGMEFDIRVYEPGRYSSAEAMAADIVAKLKSTGETEAFSYEGRRAILAELGFSLGGSAMKGYAIFIQGRKAAATATPASTPAEPSYALLAFSGATDFPGYSDFVLSCLDSFIIDSAALRSPGPLSQYALAWPPDRAAIRKVKLPGGSVADLPWSDQEGGQEIDTATREYKVLQAYKDSADLWLDAWQRFYRMVYRESAARLDRLALEFARLLPLDDPTESTRRVLAWVQDFVYERDEKGIDFVTPLHAAYEARGDCDARAMVAAIILQRLGIDSILMLSREYSHAMLGVDVPGGGQRFPWDGKKWLVGETTAKVGLGMMAQEQADFSKWLGVEFLH